MSDQKRLGEARTVLSGDDERIASSSIGCMIEAAGYDARIAVSGPWSRIQSSGSQVQIASCGTGADIASSGYFDHIASAGNAAYIASSGENARIACSGINPRVDSCGLNTVIACADSVHHFRVGPRGCIAVPWHDGSRIRFATLYEGEQIKAGVWYALNRRGEPIEIENP